jgi:exodeoxyribonuclease-3
MKIITWNVNGLRAAMKKGAMAWLLTQEPDVICLQEINLDQPIALSIRTTGCYQLWNPAED